MAASIWWLQTWLGATEKRWLRPLLSEVLSGGKSLCAGAAAAGLGSHHGFLAATSNAREAVGGADLGLAGEQPMRLLLGEEAVRRCCEPQNHLGPLPVVFEAPVMAVQLLSERGVTR